jgi:hypothetical protein
MGAPNRAAVRKKSVHGQGALHIFSPPLYLRAAGIWGTLLSMIFLPSQFLASLMKKRAKKFTAGKREMTSC